VNCYTELPREVSEDGEGVQIMEVLGTNISWLLKMRDKSRETIPVPGGVSKIMTNFNR
jgi:hypothetical protein